MTQNSALTAPSTDAIPDLVCDHPGHAPQYWIDSELGKRHQKRCYWCGETYYIGPHSGTLFLIYYEAESRFWQHCAQSKRHQAVLLALALKQQQDLKEIPQSVRKAKQAQKDLENPLYLKLKEILT